MCMFNVFKGTTIPDKMTSYYELQAEPRIKLNIKFNSNVYKCRNQQL